MAEVKKVRTRKEIPQNSKWNVEKVYKNTEEWEKDFEVLKKMVPQFKEYEGQLHIGEKLLGYIKFSEEVARLGDKLMVFACLRSDEDTSNTVFQNLKNKMSAYSAQVGNAKAFFVPEILSISEETMKNNINNIEGLKMYEFYLEDILKMKPHTLTKEKEELIASVSDCLNAPGNIYSMLTNADMTFPVIKDEDGNDIELTGSNYGSFINSKNREVRKTAFANLFNTYGKYRNTFAASLTSSIKSFIFDSKVRNYKCALEASLKPNNIPVEVYYNTVDTINKNLHLLHRYVKVKKKLLGLDEMHMYDLYVPAIETPKEHIEFEAGVKLINEALKPLGTEYLSIFNEGVESSWIDVYENKGKRGGAYSWGTYDTMPYVLLNYNYELGDVSTLAHEMGHSIHSYYSRKTQPFIYGDYTLFCAEVASTTNECLLINYMINKETDKMKRLYLINHQLEQIRTTVFRQTMFAEFEKITHETMENGTPLTADDLSKIWHELNVKYFGPDMIVDEEIDMEWSRIPHFYRDFYVYQYATGYSAANSFANMILEKGEEAVEKYKGFLKSGGSDYSINILKNAGVDMITPKPIEDTMKTFERLLDMLEA